MCSRTWVPRLFFFLNLSIAALWIAISNAFASWGSKRPTELAGRYVKGVVGWDHGGCFVLRVGYRFTHICELDDGYVYIQL